MITFCPKSGDECIKKIQPRPKSIFLMSQTPKGNDENKAIERVVIGTLEKSRSKYRVIIGRKIHKSGDFLCKLCQNIRAVTLGIAIYSNETPSLTLGNIFYEVGL